MEITNLINEIKAWQTAQNETIDRIISKLEILAEVHEKQAEEMAEPLGDIFGVGKIQREIGHIPTQDPTVAHYEMYGVPPGMLN